MNSTPRRIGLAALANLMVFALGAHDWPEFRGPTGQGHSPGKNVPIRWSVTENVAWKTAISGSGWSSPVLVDGRLYLTTSKSIEGAKDLKLTAICLDSRDGKLLWSTNVFSPQDGSSLHRKNGHASLTPLVRDGRIHVHFGHFGTACLNLDGDVLWRQTAINYGTLLRVGRRHRDLRRCKDRQGALERALGCRLLGVPGVRRRPHLFSERGRRGLRRRRSSIAFLRESCWRMLCSRNRRQRIPLASRHSPRWSPSAAMDPPNRSSCRGNFFLRELKAQTPRAIALSMSPALPAAAEDWPQRDAIWRENGTLEPFPAGRAGLRGLRLPHPRRPRRRRRVLHADRGQWPPQPPEKHRPRRAPRRQPRQRQLYRDHYSLQRLRRLADRSQLADRSVNYGALNVDELRRGGSVFGQSVLHSGSLSSQRTGDDPRHLSSATSGKPEPPISTCNPPPGISLDHEHCRC